MSSRVLVVFFGLVAISACRPPTAPAAPPAGSGTAGAGVSSTALFDAQQTLDRLDERVAMPLLPMMANRQKQDMRDHLLAVQEIVLAAGSGDFAAVERAAGRMGYSEQMARMCTHMGAGAPGFNDQALNFHHTADRIAGAARERDRKRVLTELGATLQICTSCHATWKQQIVDERTWQRLTSIAAPVHGAAHEATR